MSVLHDLFEGFAAASTFTNLSWTVLGAVLGTLIGLLPGLGNPAAALAILLATVAKLISERAVSAGLAVALGSGALSRSDEASRRNDCARAGLESRAGRVAGRSG